MVGLIATLYSATTTETHHGLSSASYTFKCQGPPLNIRLGPLGSVHTLRVLGGTPLSQILALTHRNGWSPIG